MRVSDCNAVILLFTRQMRAMTSFIFFAQFYANASHYEETVIIGLEYPQDAYEICKTRSITLITSGTRA